MSKKSLAEWIAVILCLLVSPPIIMFLTVLAGALHRTYDISIFWGIVICIVAGLIVLLIAICLLEKLIYFIIK